MAYYEIPDNPEYSTEIRKLENSDPASAEKTFNPLFQALLNNIQYLHDNLSGNIPDFSASLTRMGHTLYKTDTDTAQWGMENTYFCKENSNGEENTTDIGAAVLAMAMTSPTVNLRISGDINVNYGPIVIPNLTASPFKNLTVSLDFSSCNIKCPNKINYVFGLVNITAASNISQINIKGLTLDHDVAPLSIIDVTPSYPHAVSVYVDGCKFIMGRQSTQKITPTLITEGSVGVYPTYHFVNCIFESNYKEDYSADFDTARIITAYPSDTYKSFVFFEGCKFLFFDDNTDVGAMASSYGGYGITNLWKTENQFFRFCGCVMSTHILSAQTYFSDINTATNLQYIFNNSEITNGNILFT